MKTVLFSILAVPFALCQEAQNPPQRRRDPGKLRLQTRLLAPRAL